MDALIMHLKVLLLLVVISIGSNAVPHAYTEYHHEHHADEPANIYIFKQYGSKIIM